jgi:hypothetical protein
MINTSRGNNRVLCQPAALSLDMSGGRGRPEEYEDDEFIEAIRAADPPAVGTVAIAEAVGCSERAAFKRLSRLADEGLLAGLKVGRSQIWWIPEDQGSEGHHGMEIEVLGEDNLPPGMFFSQLQELRIRELARQEAEDVGEG